MGTQPAPERQFTRNRRGAAAPAGWACLPERSDDGGFTGGNLERPTLRRLLADLEAGKIDCVLVVTQGHNRTSPISFDSLLHLDIPPPTASMIRDGTAFGKAAVKRRTLRGE